MVWFSSTYNLSLPNLPRSFCGNSTIEFFDFNSKYIFWNSTLYNESKSRKKFSQKIFRITTNVKNQLVNGSPKFLTLISRIMFKNLNCFLGSYLGKNLFHNFNSKNLITSIKSLWWLYLFIFKNLIVNSFVYYII